MNQLLLAVAINCINANNMVICDNGVTVYNHGRQSDVYTAKGSVAEVYKPHNQINIYTAQEYKIMPAQTIDLSPLGLDPLR